MKLPYLMIQNFLPLTLSADELGDVLTMLGFEVEGVDVIENEPVFDIKVCSNRGDGLSAFGIARELAAKFPDLAKSDLFVRALQRFPRADDIQPSEMSVPVEVISFNCSRFAYRGFRGVRNGDSPQWMQKCLRLAGMRPISLLVDVTNYVMLELGQPLHAYDLKRLAGPRIVVRQARDGEVIKTLDGKDHDLTVQNLMICDGDGPIGVAGVMGGEATEVSADTSEVLLESAHFDAGSIRKTRQVLGMSTDASYRFERSVDPEGTVGALNRVAELLEEAGQGAALVSGVSDTYPKKKPARTVELRFDRLRTLLGMNVTDAEASKCLTGLGFQLEPMPGGVKALVPTWRFDIEIENDLVEEVGRVYGYDKIPVANLVGEASQGGVHGRFQIEELLTEIALRSGFDQAMTHSLCGSSPLDDQKREKIPIRTPGSPETAFLRNSLLPGLVETLRRNGASGVRFFEIGSVFLNEPHPLATVKRLGLVGSGGLWQPNRKGDVVAAMDFFAMKATIEGLAAVLNDRLEFSVPSSPDPRLHPTRQARFNGELISGFIGQLHPEVTEAEGVPADVIVAEVELANAIRKLDVGYMPVSRNPSVRRDIAMLLDQKVPYAAVEGVIRSTLSAVLEDIWLFDVYSGQGIPEGMHSLGIAMTFRKAGENFTDSEADRLRDEAVKALGSLGAKQR